MVMAPMPAYRLEPTLLWPPAFFAASSAIVGYSRQLACLRQRQTTAADCYKDGRSSVVYLGTHCCPDAVLLAIALIVVDALYRMLWRWSPSHVTQEGAVVFPFFADRNPSLNIVWVVYTAALHVRPSGVLRGTPVSPCLSVDCDSFLMCATAAEADAASEVSRSDGSPISAITTTEPDSAATSLIYMREVEHDPSPIAVASEVLISLGSHRVLSEGSRVRGAVEPGSSMALRYYSEQEV